MRASLASDLLYELGSVLQGYPGFIFSGRAPSLVRHVPVFVYHGIEPTAFEADLRFLAENGYRTLGMDGLLAHLDGRVPAGRAVVLSFDDARSSFWRFGYPLLRRYGMKGVQFVIAGMTLDAPACRPNLSDAWDGRCSPEELAALDPDDTTLCTWPELKEMHASGVVEIESHSLFHREVFVSGRLVDFLGPDSSFVPFLTPATAYLGPADIGRPIAPESLYGLPLFPAAPLHQAIPALEPAEELRRLAATLWNGLPEELRRGAAWRPALRARWSGVDVERYLRRQTPADVERAITEDLAAARALIKEKVDASAGDHLCFPYTVGSDVSLSAAERLGIRSCSWGVVRGRKHNVPGGSPLRICRIKADFLRRLPGVGQATLPGIYARKLERRIKGERVY